MKFELSGKAQRFKMLYFHETNDAEAQLVRPRGFAPTGLEL